MAKKETKTALLAKAEAELERSMEDLLDVIVDDLKEHYKSDLEPFDLYAQKVRSHLYSSIEEYHKRFVKGYSALLEQIKKE